MLTDVLSNRHVPNPQHIHPFVSLRHSLQDFAALVEQARLVVSQGRQRPPSRSGHARCHRRQDRCVSHPLPKTIHHHKFTDRHLCSVQRINPDGNFPHQVFNSPISRTVFPPFHRATMRSQLQLHVADNVGRITVGLSEGNFYVAGGRPHFSPIKDVVTFKWIHAPQSK
jgi:hypothetical protein